jgi:hypothetical protein
MFWASLACTVVYLVIALQGPRVWTLAKGPGARLLGVLLVQVFAIGAGFLALIIVGGSIVESTGAESLRGASAAARTLLLPAGTIVFSFIAAIAHWSRHGRDGDASAAIAHRSGVSYARVSTDPLKAELRRREEAAQAERRLDEARLRLESARAEQAALLAVPSPQGDPTGWSTDVLRTEIERRSRVDRLAAQIAELTDQVDPPTRVQPADRKSETADLRHRLAQLQEWNKLQRP